MKSKILMSVTVCVVLLVVSKNADVYGAKAYLRSFYECEGNACSVIELNWDNERQQFRVKNDSNQRVKIEVSTFAGTSSLTVPGKEVGYLEVKTFNGPYRANYE